MKTDLQNKLLQFQKLLFDASANLSKQVGNKNLAVELNVLNDLLKKSELNVAIAELEADNSFKPQTAAATSIPNLNDVVMLTIKFYLALIQAENLFHKYSPDRLRIQDRILQKKWIQNVLQLSDQYPIPEALLREVHEVAKPSVMVIPDWKGKPVETYRAPETISLSELDKERLKTISQINAKNENLTKVQQKSVANYVATLEAGIETIDPEIMRKRIDRVNPKLLKLFPPSEDPDAELNALAKKAHDERLERRGVDPYKNKRKRKERNDYPGGMFDVKAQTQASARAMSLRSEHIKQRLK